MTNNYAVIQPDGPTRGIVISRHPTIEAAREAIGQERSALVHSRRYRNTRERERPWLEREIVQCDETDTRPYRNR